jgi:hypothetical protein
MGCIGRIVGPTSGEMIVSLLPGAYSKTDCAFERKGAKTHPTYQTYPTSQTSPTQLGLFTVSE